MVAVQAYDSQKISDYSNLATVITPSAIAQGAPQLFYTLDDSIITVFWQPVPNATDYILNYSLSEFSDEDSFIPAGLQGTWNISGHQLTTNPQTEFDQVDGPLIIGGCAKVDLRNGLVHEIDSEPIDDCR